MAKPPESEPILRLGIKYEDHKDNPPEGLTWRKVNNGETLGSLANEYGVRAMDIALYNWHTVQPAQINWYMKHYVGCHHYAGRSYQFSATDQPGQILVPDIPGRLRRTPPKNILAVRDGAAKLDGKLQLQVLERLAKGSSLIEVSGKWLYVFSAGSGTDFGYEPPPPLPLKIEVETPVPDAAQPGSAFTLDFPGTPHINKKPEKLDYEIFISAKDEASSDLVLAVSGESGAMEARYKPGNQWHFLTDQTLLKQANKDGRHKRTSHAFRPTQMLSIDVSHNRRYYFLLSPFQLGPQAINYAMQHPNGLTPLLKPGLDKHLWDPTHAGGEYPQTDINVGPGPDDVEKGVMKLGVIDPYAWAESIAGSNLATSFTNYSEWINGKKNSTTVELKKKTGWTMDEYFVAQILKSVRDCHLKPAKIDGELRDPDKWKSDLELWEKELVRRNAEISADLHRSLLELLEWLDGPAHWIIETAALKDTVDDNQQDALDIGHAILHWALCTTNMIGLEPGVVYLQDLLSKAGNVPYDVVLKHFKDIDHDVVKVTVKDKDKTALRYGSHGVLMLLSLQEFLSPKPPVPDNPDQVRYRMDLEKAAERRRDNLIRIFNDLHMFPVKVQKLSALPPANVPFGWSILSTVLNAVLDAADKWTSYVIDPDINIPKNKGRILNSLANLEEWFGRQPKWFTKGVNLGSSYALKSFALGASGYNLYTTITKARFDYQNKVTGADWTGAAAGMTMAVQDVLAEIAALTESEGLQRIFPQLTTSAVGKSWTYGVGATEVSGWGAVFAGFNVVAMLLSGALTVYSMGKGLVQAKGRADYTSAVFYGVGVIGGVMMVGGAIFVGLALMKVGGIFTATGAGATIGVGLFALGGIIAAVGAINAWAFSSDDYQLFARKCFLGTNSSDEPRFGGDPPAWTLAGSSGDNTWPINLQRQALYNLLGRFKLTSALSGTFARDAPYHNTVTFELVPGLVMPGSRFELALHCGPNGSQTKASLEWRKYGKDVGLQLTAREPVEVQKGPLFDADAAFAQFEYNSNSDLSRVKLYAYQVTYNGFPDSLLATVSLRSPDSGNYIRCRKLVMERGAVWGVNLDDDERTSEIFD